MFSSWFPFHPSHHDSPCANEFLHLVQKKSKSKREANIKNKIDTHKSHNCLSCFLISKFLLSVSCFKKFTLFFTILLFFFPLFHYHIQGMRWIPLSTNCSLFKRYFIEIKCWILSATFYVGNHLSFELEQINVKEFITICLCINTICVRVHTPSKYNLFILNLCNL